MKKELKNKTSFELDEYSSKILQYKFIKIIFHKLYKENEITEDEYHRFFNECEKKSRNY